jgi:hypothetical protein
MPDQGLVNCLDPRLYHSGKGVCVYKVGGRPKPDPVFLSQMFDLATLGDLMFANTCRVPWMFRFMHRRFTNIRSVIAEGAALEILYAPM